MRGTGQKLNDITEIPNELGITHTEETPDSAAVTFAPDQHRSVFSRSWLAGHALDRYADGDGRTEDDKELVDGFAAAVALGRPGRGPGGHPALLRALRAAMAALTSSATLRERAVAS